MPLVLIVVGLTLLFAAINNTHQTLFKLVSGDFTGQGSFIYWLAAIAVVGGVGYIPGMRGISHAFLALILIVLLLNSSKNDPTGFFNRINEALASTSAAPPIQVQTGGSSGSSGGSSSLPSLPQIGQIASQLPAILSQGDFAL